MIGVCSCCYCCNCCARPMTLKGCVKAEQGWAGSGLYDNAMVATNSFYSTHRQEQNGQGE